MKLRSGSVLVGPGFRRLRPEEAVSMENVELAVVNPNGQFEDGDQQVDRAVARRSGFHLSWCCMVLILLGLCFACVVVALGRSCLRVCPSINENICIMLFFFSEFMRRQIF